MVKIVATYENYSASSNIEETFRKIIGSDPIDRQNFNGYKGTPFCYLTYDVGDDVKVAKKSLARLKRYILDELYVDTYSHCHAWSDELGYVRPTRKSG